jgi:hypothetical protein
MSTSTEVARLTPGARLARGLKYTIAGPLHLLLGALGIGFGSVRSIVGLIGGRCRGANDSGEDLVAVEDLLPTKSGRRRPLLFVVVTVAMLAVGGAVFSIVRRSMQPEPSVLPPSVDVTPQP